ncbi:ABC transporter [Clostridioides difficile]|nr:ABC transporter [Clostridioides difficile]
MIELKNVSFTYESSESENGLQNINLKIRDGETLLLCGESGCGKTTLTRLINGLIPHYYDGKLTGEILLDGQEIKEYPLYEIAKKVGSVFQNPRTQFYNVETTNEIVFGCENMAMSVPDMIRRLEETTKSLKLEKLLNRSLFALSGGEKQKIACASADAIQPDIFVLDEPTSNLDIDAIEDLIHVIKHWQSEKKTVIVAEHRLYYLVPYADRIIYMKHGRIQKEFSREEFQCIMPEELKKMGLRALDPFNLFPESKMKQNGQTLHIRDFFFSYEKHGLVNLDVPDLVLPQGEIIGIIGNNGAGKSTFARCLCGLDKKAKGTLESNGIIYDRKKRLNASYMVMQDVNHQLFTENVLDELLLSMDGEDEEIDSANANKILFSLDLSDKVEIHPMSLSGGEKQRVAIGSAVASNKEIMVFDEPTSGLDYRHMIEVSENLNRLKEMGKSLFLITHDPELIYKCCTYLLFIENGRVLWHRQMDNTAANLLHVFSLMKRVV